ncbi:MAG: serine/threonine protein kinase, partial [Planctomycetes bacterium]|nr:serine/threonine protein kinase [Planctomycetota bacterium]
MSKHLGPYALEAELGRGGMGTVYRARDTRSGRAVALKTLTDVSANLAQLERFRLEAEALRGLVHPHLVEVLDLSLAPPQPYAVFELVEGETLAARVKREGPLPWPTAARIASEVASGVAAAHERGLLHRDLKPDNVLLGPAGAKLADFGLVKDLDRETLTQSGATLGTPSYMAPEQIGSQKDRWGPPTDVYGLAATLYFALTGRPPFTGPTTVAILHAVLQDAPPQPSALAPDVPRWLDAVCLRGLAKENAERFPSAIAFRLALLQPAAAGDGRALRRALALSAGVALLGLAGLGLALALPQRSADPPTPAVAAESSLAPVPSGSGEKPLTAAQSAGLEVATKAAVQGALWLAVSEIRDAAKAAKTADQVTRLVERVTKCRGTLSRMSPPKRAELEAGLADAVWSALQRLSKKPEDYRAARAGRLYELLIQDDQPLSLELLLALIDHLNRDTDGVFPPETFPAWGDRAEALLRGLSGVEQGPRWVLLARLRLQQTPPAPRDAVRALREALEHDLGEGLQLEAARLAERAKNFPLVAQVVEPLRGKRLHPSNRPEFERLCLLADGDPRQVTKSTVTTEASLQSFLDSTQGLVLRGPTPAAPLLTLARSALG